MDKGNYAGHAWAAAYTHGGCGHAFHDHLPPRDFSPRTASTHYAPPAHVADVRSWALTHAFLSPEIPTNFSSATVPSGSSPARERERERGEEIELPDAARITESTIPKRNSRRFFALTLILSGNLWDKDTMRNHNYPTIARGARLLLVTFGNIVSA